jgi:probable rRNA maturation factor
MKGSAHIIVAIASRQRTKKINRDLLRRVIAALLAELEIANAELGVCLVGSKEMARVNRQFLQHEGSTDVITFDHRDVDRGAKHPAGPLHGELFICVDDAVKQAEEFGTSWRSEIVRYAVHGVLHLLGHDDLKPDPRRKMKRAENRLVRRLEKSFPLSELELPPPAKS